MSKAWPCLVLLAALVLVAIVHRPLLRFFFHADDYLHLYRASIDSVPQFLLRTHGGHLLGTWRAVFLLYRAVFGLQTELWFAAVLATHLLNVGLLYRTIRILTGSVGLAGGASALWGVSPLARGSLGWLSVYPHVLLATWVLWALLDVVRVARREYEPSGWTLLRWILLMLLAANSFGIGLGVAMAFPLSCALLLRDSDLHPRFVLPLFALLILVPVNWMLMGWFDPDPIVDLTTVSLSDVLEPGWTSLWSPLVLLAWLLAYAIAGTAVGPVLDLSLPASLSVAVGPLAGTPFETARLLIATAGTVIPVAAALLLVRADARTRRDTAALLLLLAACYAPVALGRWWATPEYLPWLPDVPVWTRPRYHYLGTALVWLTLCSSLPVALRWTVRHRRSLAVVACAWIGLAVRWSFEAAPEFTKANPEQERLRFEAALASIERQILEVPRGATAYLPNLPFALPIPVPPGHFPGSAAIYAIVHRKNEIEERRVHFVESNEETLAVSRHRDGERMRDLLLSPTEVPGHGRPMYPVQGHGSEAGIAPMRKR